jgi:hypothetical protein
MEPAEPVPHSKTDAPISSTPGARSRPKWPITEIIDDLRELNAVELADVQQYVKHVRAARGDRPSPELISKVLLDVGHLHATYAYHVPISLIRARHAEVPRTLLDLALFDAEDRDLLRMEPVELPAPFVEVGAGIPHVRGLLYWIVPHTP